MPARVSRALFCCTSILNRRHAGREGARVAKCSYRKTAVMSHAPFRRWGWADTGSHPAFVQGSRMGRLVWPIPLVWGLLLSGLWLVLSGCAASAPPRSVAHSFDQRAHTHRDEHVRVRVSILSAEGCVAVFGVPLYEVGVQPVAVHR